MKGVDNKKIIDSLSETLNYWLTSLEVSNVGNGPSTRDAATCYSLGERLLCLIANDDVLNPSQLSFKIIKAWIDVAKVECFGLGLSVLKNVIKSISPDRFSDIFVDVLGVDNIEKIYTHAFCKFDATDDAEMEVVSTDVGSFWVGLLQSKYRDEWLKIADRQMPLTVIDDRGHEHDFFCYALNLGCGLAELVMILKETPINNLAELISLAVEYGRMDALKLLSDSGDDVLDSLCSSDDSCDFLDEKDKSKIYQHFSNKYKILEPWSTETGRDYLMPSKEVFDWVVSNVDQETLKNDLINLTNIVNMESYKVIASERSERYEFLIKSIERRLLLDIGSDTTILNKSQQIL